MGLGLTWGFPENRFANVYALPWTVVEGVGGQSIQCVAIFYYMCVVAEVGGIQLQSCQNMIKPKRKDYGCLPSPHPVFSNSFPSIELTENQS